MSALMGAVATIATAEQSRQPILISGIQEPEEMRVEPFPSTKGDLTAPERMLGEALQKSDNSKPATLLPALNTILAQYPDFSDGYIMRAFALCDPGNDRAAITADLDRALKSIASLRFGKTSKVSLLSTRAKMEYLGGNYLNAMISLEQAIRSDLGKATEFTNSGEVKPEKKASVCVWAEPDMDALVHARRVLGVTLRDVSAHTADFGNKFSQTSNICAHRMAPSVCVVRLLGGAPELMLMLG
jgi:hypothetical protein